MSRRVNRRPLHHGEDPGRLGEGVRENAWLPDDVGCRRDVAKRELRADAADTEI